MTAGKPLVTINIVTRNRAQALRRAIESAYAQTYRPIEIVVVDNGSTDGTAQMVQSRWPDVRLIQVHRNIGSQPGRNIGMKNSRGQYIFNLDDDGALESTVIEQVVARFEAEPDVALVAAAIEPMRKERAALVKARRLRAQRYIADFPGGASAIRASVLPEVGYFPEYVRGYVEADLGLRIIDRRYEMVYLPDAIMYHDVSDIRPSSNRIRYYLVWHRLETCFRREPWPRCLGSGLWRVAYDFVFALRHGTFLGYLAGVLRFLYELPRILWQRKPVSRWALEKVDYLNYNFVTDGSQSRQFERFSIWQAIRRRLRGEHLRLAPKGQRDGG